MSYSLNSLQGGHVGEYYRGYKGIYQEFRLQLIYLFQISPVSMQEPQDHIHTNVPTAGGLEGLCPRVERHRKCQQHLRHAQDVSVNPMKTAPLKAALRRTRRAQHPSQNHNSLNSVKGVIHTHACVRVQYTVCSQINGYMSQQKHVPADVYAAGCQGTCRVMTL